MKNIRLHDDHTVNGSNGKPRLPFFLFLFETYGTGIRPGHSLLLYNHNSRKIITPF
jgi:hypothetical protein